MIPAFIDVGWLGSPIDVATFVVVLVTLGYEIRPRVDTLAAAVVALARQDHRVDDERLVSVLNVDEDDVASIETTVVSKPTRWTDGADDGGDT
jgi:hypothetical protein